MTPVAFFDLDYTLLDTSSGLMYVRQIVRQRRAPLTVVGWLTLLYQLKRISFAEAHARLIRHVGQAGVAETQPFFDGWVHEKLLPHLTEAGRAKIEWHQQQGQPVLIVSASIEEIVRPVAQSLKLEYLCTRLETQANRYTGAVAGPPCYGPGKVHWVQQWCVSQGLEFAQAAGYFYSDSASDLPLLEQVRHPVAVNPSRKLARIAAERGWSIEMFY